MRGEGQIAKKKLRVFLSRLSKFLLRAKKKKGGGLTGDKSQTQDWRAKGGGGMVVLSSPPHCATASLLNGYTNPPFLSFRFWSLPFVSV